MLYSRMHHSLFFSRAAAAAAVQSLFYMYIASAGYSLLSCSRDGLRTVLSTPRFLDEFIYISWRCASLLFAFIIRALF